MAEHVAGTSVLVVRIHAGLIRGTVMTVAAVLGVGVAGHQDVVSERSFPGRRIPTEARRKHCRQ